jgi:hypothetical protein
MAGARGTAVGAGNVGFMGGVGTLDDGLDRNGISREEGYWDGFRGLKGLRSWWGEVLLRYWFQDA